MLSKEDIVRRKHMWDTVEGRVHMFFQDRGFEYFRTPLVARTPGQEPYLDPIEVRILPLSKGESEGVLNTSALITSPEYAMKKLLGAGFEKIYTITPVFRNNESGPHNIPEFTMLEWYAPGAYGDLMNETEELLKLVLEDASTWPRIRHEDAGMDEHGDPHADKDRFFVTHFPADRAALAKLTPDGKYAQRFEAFANGLELCNGFAELTDAHEQRRRFEAEQEKRRSLGKTVFPIDEELLDALSKIKKPVYGNALGIDRLVMLKYGVSDIRDVQIFS